MRPIGSMNTAVKSLPTEEVSETLEDVQFGPEALDRRRDRVRAHQATIAFARQAWIKNNKYFYSSVQKLFRFLIEPGKKVLSLRCQTGFFLDAAQAGRGVGVDLSEEMIAVAKSENPNFEFQVSNPEDYIPSERFDYIIFSDVGDTVEVSKVLNNLHAGCERHTRLIIYSYNHLWEPVVNLAVRLKLRMPLTDQNWLSEDDLSGLLELSNFELLKSFRILLFPYYVPLLSTFLNRFIARLPLINRLCFLTVLVARPTLAPKESKHFSVSVIIPCKNEKGNVEVAVNRIPQMGAHTEIIFCDDRSTDGTAEEVLRVKQARPDRDIQLAYGPGICKAKNVWIGFEKARGDILMILDADLTVMPEELPLFVEAIVSNKGEFINGSRLVYPLPKAAMKTFNMFGNKVFGLIFTYLLGRRTKDTLCGTKVIWRTDWERIRPYIGNWGVTDRWGDYDLLLSAAKLNLKIVDLPVHYQERVYGVTKMVNVVQNGIHMLKISYYGFQRLKLWY